MGMHFVNRFEITQTIICKQIECQYVPENFHAMCIYESMLCECVCVFMCTVHSHGKNERLPCIYIVWNVKEQVQHFDSWST